VADQGDVDLPVQGGDDVGELSSDSAGAQIDGAFERLFEEGSFGLRESDYRAGWALLGGILNARTGLLEVGVVEELGAGKGGLDFGDIGFAGTGSEGSVECRVASMPGRARKAHGEPGSEAEASAVGDLEVA